MLVLHIYRWHLGRNDIRACRRDTIHTFAKRVGSNSIVPRIQACFITTHTKKKKCKKSEQQEHNRITFLHLMRASKDKTDNQLYLTLTLTLTAST